MSQFSVDKLPTCDLKEYDNLVKCSENVPVPTEAELKKNPLPKGFTGQMALIENMEKYMATEDFAEIQRGKRGGASTQLTTGSSGLRQRRRRGDKDDDDETKDESSSKSGRKKNRFPMGLAVLLSHLLAAATVLFMLYVTAGPAWTTMKHTPFIEWLTSRLVMLWHAANMHYHLGWALPCGQVERWLPAMLDLASSLLAGVGGYAAATAKASGAAALTIPDPTGTTAITASSTALTSTALSTAAFGSAAALKATSGMVRDHLQCQLRDSAFLSGMRMFATGTSAATLLALGERFLGKPISRLYTMIQQNIFSMLVNLTPEQEAELFGRYGLQTPSMQMTKKDQGGGRKTRRKYRKHRKKTRHRGKRRSRHRGKRRSHRRGGKRRSRRRGGKRRSRRRGGKRT